MQCVGVLLPNAAVVQAEVIKVLAEGHALHLLPPASAIPALNSLCSPAANGSTAGRQLTAACHHIVLSHLLPRSFSASSLAADLVVCAVAKSLSTPAGAELQR